MPNLTYHKLKRMKEKELFRIKRRMNRVRLQKRLNLPPRPKSNNYPINLDIPTTETPIITKENAYVKEDFDDYINILKKVRDEKLSIKNLEKVIDFFEELKHNRYQI